MKEQDISWKILNPHFETFNLGLQADLSACDYTRLPEFEGLSPVSLCVKDDIFHKEMHECNQIIEQGQN